MARRRKEGLLDILAQLPWWVSVVLSVLAYWFLTSFFRHGAATQGPFGPMFSIMGQFLPNFVTVLLLIPALVSFVNQMRSKRLLDQQKGIDSIRKLKWKEFEFLIGEYYRRMGFSVKENPSKGADGGIDLELSKDGKRHLVQCKKYNKSKVSVTVVREMYGVMMSEHAASVIIVSTGGYTKDAIAWAEGKSITLIDGEQLVPMIYSVQQGRSEPPVSDPVIAQDQVAAKSCRQCGAEMVKRKAKKGIHAGKEFWGCSRFPQCRYTEN